MPIRREHDPALETDLGRVIVPMLDMSFQLLFFFVATFNPGRAEGKMSLSLPASGQAKAASMQDVDPTQLSSPDLDLKSDLVVRVSSHEDSFSLSLGSAENKDKDEAIGALRGLTPQTRKDEIGKLMDQLREKLATKLKDKRDTDGPDATIPIKIEANKKTKHADVVAVMDACLLPAASKSVSRPRPTWRSDHKTCLCFAAMGRLLVAKRKHL